MIIVLVSHGKGNDKPFAFAVKLFESKDEATVFIEKINSPDEKYWTVAEIVQDGNPVEPARDGYSHSTNDFMKV